MTSSLLLTLLILSLFIRIVRCRESYSHKHHNRNQQQNWDPYRVLGLLGSNNNNNNNNNHHSSDNSPSLDEPSVITQDDIRRAYRAKCLVYHPDKNVHLPKKQQLQREEAFKSVQQAYDEIGDPDRRRLYDLKQQQQSSMYSAFGYGSGSASTSYSPFAAASYSSSSYPTPDDVFQFYHRQQAANSPFPRRSGSVPIFRFDRRSGASWGSSSSSTSPRQHPTASTAATPKWLQKHCQNIYVQRIPISLEDLYCGTTVQAQVSTTLWSRAVAAFRGGFGYLLLYQSLLFALPLLRLSKWVAASWGLYVFHYYLPNHHDNDNCKENNSYTLKILPGYKGGTKLTFQDEMKNSKVVFVLQEQRHKLYRRIHNDLHVTVSVTPQQAQRGCVVKLPNLDNGGHNINAQSSIPISIPAGYGSTATPLIVKGKGWPNRRNHYRKGDLVVTVRIDPNLKSKTKKEKTWR